MSSNSRIFLYPGELVIAQHDEEVMTILGSCVSIILHSQRARISAVNHAQQPAMGGDISCRASCPHPCGKAAIPDHKYVTCSFDYMWERLMALGVSAHELKVGLYGGATSELMTGSPFSVANKNIEAAEAAIAARGLRIHQRDVGGHLSRKLLHDSETGITRMIG